MLVLCLPWLYLPWLCLPWLCLPWLCLPWLCLPWLYLLLTMAGRCAARAGGALLHTCYLLWQGDALPVLVVLCFILATYYGRAMRCPCWWCSPSGRAQATLAAPAPTAGRQKSPLRQIGRQAGRTSTAQDGHVAERREPLCACAHVLMACLRWQCSLGIRHAPAAE
jgi:hypothetical protein